jgi:hypothetical protein
LKRMIGRFVVAAVLSGGAMVAVASPSSAVRDNPCMDAANYNSQVQWYQDQWSASFDVLEAWENADHYVNPVTGQEVWEATYLGGTHTAYSQSDVNQNINVAATSMGQWDTALSGFLDVWSVCP